MKLTNDVLEFINIHKSQLQSSGVPEHFWKTLYTKIKNSDYNLESNFALCKVDYDEERKKEEPIFVLQVINEQGVKKDDIKQIYLIDHAWTFRVANIRENLNDIDSLLVRMCNLMGVDNSSSKGERIETVCDEMWRYCQSYTIGNAASVEDRLPIWYIMDEVGCAIVHSEEPNFRTVPFVLLPDKVTYTFMFPVSDVEYGAFVSRDYAEGVEDEEVKKRLLLPWKDDPGVAGVDFKLTEPGLEYFLSGHIEETLPSVTEAVVRGKVPLRVYSEYEIIRNNLNRPEFQIVDDETDADVLWYTSHFKDYAELRPEKFVNQYPFENVLTIKDLLSIVCRRKAPIEGGYPDWYPTTFNLKTELPQFVSYYKSRESRNEDNHWICKPWNLARGLDTHITSNLNYILRLSSVNPPKIAQKYIENPVLFRRDDIGASVKFDVRYVILLKSVSPLKVYVYRNFFLRFSNKPFGLTDFHDYEKHFTVMNYSEETQLKKMLADEFVRQWDEQQDVPWSKVEEKIFDMLRQLFEAATEKPSPKGIAACPNSRALYAADLMLERNDKRTVQPKLLEVNWTPDCKRACDYYPDFYNKIFGLLFLDEVDGCFVEL